MNLVSKTVTADNVPHYSLLNIVFWRLYAEDGSDLIHWEKLDVLLGLGKRSETNILSRQLWEVESADEIFVMFFNSPVDYEYFVTIWPRALDFSLVIFRISYAQDAQRPSLPNVVFLHRGSNHVVVLQLNCSLIVTLFGKIFLPDSQIIDPWNLIIGAYWNFSRSCHFTITVIVERPHEISFDVHGFGFLQRVVKWEPNCIEVPCVN